MQKDVQSQNLHEVASFLNKNMKYLKVHVSYYKILNRKNSQIRENCENYRILYHVVKSYKISSNKMSNIT